MIGVSAPAMNQRTVPIMATGITRVSSCVCSVVSRVVIASIGVLLLLSINRERTVRAGTAWVCAGQSRCWAGYHLLSERDLVGLGAKGDAQRCTRPPRPRTGPGLRAPLAD